MHIKLNLANYGTEFVPDIVQFLIVSMPQVLLCRILFKIFQTLIMIFPKKMSLTDQLIDYLTRKITQNIY